MLLYFGNYADMAELADAYGSGPYESNFMQVQVLLSAPRKRDNFTVVKLSLFQLYLFFEQVVLSSIVLLLCSVIVLCTV